MSEGEPIDTATGNPGRPGERLREARMAQGLDIGDIAQRTRIPQRHLESIEVGTYSSLPSATYAVGFGKAYARTVGIDEVALASDIRAEISSNWDRKSVSTPVYEIEDDSRQPSRGLVLGGVVIALLLLLGVFLWYGTNIFRGGQAGSGGVAAPATEVAMPVPAPGTAAPDATPQVAITANDEVWVRIYDAADTTLLMKTMAAGERFEVPANANTPMINVGRPDKLSITVNGAAVAPLGDGRRAIKDVPIAAAALLARGGPQPSPGATPTAQPTSVPTPRVTATPRPNPTTSSAPAPRAAEPVAPPPATGNGIDAP